MKRWVGCRCFAVLLAVVLLLAGAPLHADNVAVRFPEGLTRGFLAVSNQAGRQIGAGDWQQTAQNGRVTIDLTVRFNDGSRYREHTVFTQRGVFHLLADHLVQTGPSFKTPLDSTIDTSSGQVTIRYKDGHGKERTVSKHMDLPADLANGLLFVLVKDMNPQSPQSVVSYVAATPEPRLVKLIFKPHGTSMFETAGVRQNAEHYVMSVSIGGVAGVIAPLIGKKPADTDIWVIGGEAPTFAASEGPFFANGPIWKLSLVSPVQASQSASR